MIPLAKAVLCVNCYMVTEAKGDRCQCCDAVGGLFNLSRVLGGTEPTQAAIIAYSPKE